MEERKRTLNPRQRQAIKQAAWTIPPWIAPVTSSSLLGHRQSDCLLLSSRAGSRAHHSERQRSRNRREREGERTSSERGSHSDKAVASFPCSQWCRCAPDRSSCKLSASREGKS